MGKHHTHTHTHTHTPSGPICITYPKGFNCWFGLPNILFLNEFLVGILLEPPAPKPLFKVCGWGGGGKQRQKITPPLYGSLITNLLGFSNVSCCRVPTPRGLGGWNGTSAGAVYAVLAFFVILAFLAALVTLWSPPRGPPRGVGSGML